MLIQGDSPGGDPVGSPTCGLGPVTQTILVASPTLISAGTHVLVATFTTGDGSYHFGGAFYELETAQKTIELAEAQKEAAKKAFRLVNKKYQQGQANLVQFTDARTRLTNSEQQLIIAKYDYQIQLAEFGRAVGK